MAMVVAARPATMPVRPKSVFRPNFLTSKLARPAAARVPLQRSMRTEAASIVDVETARSLLDGQCTVLDIRPAREYEDSRITKPPRKSQNVPFEDGSNFVAQVSSQFPNRASKLIVMCGDGGQSSSQAAALLKEAGFNNLALMEGGYAAYSKIWSPSGKRRPPAGRWMSTGKEALKSGLNVGDAALSYEEGGNLKEARYNEKGLPTGEGL